MIKASVNWYKRVPKFVRNRYMITLMVFFVYMLLFDQYDIITQFQLKKELSELERNKSYFEEQIKVTHDELDELLTNNEKLEKFAREKYLMKSPNEDIFIIVETKKPQKEESFFSFIGF